ncbi:hypothetical protein GNI_161230 [Gregarina niphandrodes]|uniref:Uncharacterized protein n=1 Tax=Gregarina niphandrodes TaxID=110365 RepID=A0A023AZI5_GRENI|nr:hypothetical protein GNI_161230 [Gregarina niphandrodes]EZG43725.1 hypothetical protein GNI_161230 [Gregarina niphandrodes]|eukprot:XP_011133055.1 hypothetical protein GNI_161230 [Gregarina niphandrodes]
MNLHDLTMLVHQEIKAPTLMLRSIIEEVLVDVGRKVAKGHNPLSIANDYSSPCPYGYKDMGVGICKIDPTSPGTVTNGMNSRGTNLKVDASCNELDLTNLGIVARLDLAHTCALEWISPNSNSRYPCPEGWNLDNDRICKSVVPAKYSCDEIPYSPFQDIRMVNSLICKAPLIQDLYGESSPACLKGSCGLFVKEGTGSIALDDPTPWIRGGIRSYDHYSSIADSFLQQINGLDYDQLKQLVESGASEPWFKQAGIYVSSDTSVCPQGYSPIEQASRVCIFTGGGTNGGTNGDTDGDTDGEQLTPSKCPLSFRQQDDIILKTLLYGICQFTDSLTSEASQGDATLSETTLGRHDSTAGVQIPFGQRLHMSADIGPVEDNTGEVYTGLPNVQDPNIKYDNLIFEPPLTFLDLKTIQLPLHDFGVFRWPTFTKKGIYKSMALLSEKERFYEDDEACEKDFDAPCPESTFVCH